MHTPCVAARVFSAECSPEPDLSLVEPLLSLDSVGFSLVTLIPRGAIDSSRTSNAADCFGGFHICRPHASPAAMRFRLCPCY
jgi:hypothetical protein